MDSLNNSPYYPFKQSSCLTVSILGAKRSCLTTIRPRRIIDMLPVVSHRRLRFVFKRITHIVSKILCTKTIKESQSDGFEVER